MPKFPNKIKIAGHVYKVLYPYRFKEDKGLHGQAEHVTLEIRLSDRDGGGCEYHKSRTIECFLHELLHCILSYYGDGKYNEEAAVECTANGLLQVLRDNPEILEIFKDLD